MNGCDWILCERSPRWTAALRLARARQSSSSLTRICEVRNLRDLAATLDARPHSLVLIEIVPTNLAAVLAWLADASRRYSWARFAALLDGEFGQPLSIHLAQSRDDRQDAIDALAEAGAAEFALSPRHLRGILALARRHQTWLASHATPPDNLSIDAWAWSLLPWQDSATRVG